MNIGSSPSTSAVGSGNTVYFIFSISPPECPEPSGGNDAASLGGNWITTPEDGATVVAAGDGDGSEIELGMSAGWCLSGSLLVFGNKGVALSAFIRAALRCGAPLLVRSHILTR